MTAVHFTLGASVFALNLIAGVWGVGAWLTRRASVGFWYVLRAGQVAVGAQLLLGLTLLIAGNRAPEDLHYIYGSLPALVAFITEGMRIGAAHKVVGDTEYADLDPESQAALAAEIFRAETRVMAIGALIITALAVRAGMSSGGL